MRALRTVALAGVAAVALSGIAIGSASADPPAGVSPATTDIVAGGSDTLTPLFDRWSVDYNKQHTTGPQFYSWDAVPPAGGSTNIQAKNNANCVSEPRPNGSGAGITELNKNVQTTDGHFCWDIARSSRAITANDGTVSSIQLAEDGITYASNSTTTNAPQGLSAGQLNLIYTCAATTWNDPNIGGASGDTIVPILPQGNSGTRATFLSDIGVSASQIGSCVVNGNGTQAIEENEGTNAAFSGSNSADVIYPYSIGAFIAQVDTKADPDLHGVLALDSMTDGNGVVQAPVSGSGSTATINTSFPILRALFAVVRTTTGVPSYLQLLLGNSNNTGWVCSNATAKADIQKEGFLLTSNCGHRTHF